MVFGVSPDSSTISTSPDLTTKNLKSRSPTSKSFSPAWNRWSFVRGQRPSAASWASSSFGKGDGVQVVLGHVSTSSGAATRSPHYRRYGTACSGTSSSA